MPRATVSTEATRHDLKSCPGGFVLLKPLPFGKMLERREMASKMSMQQDSGKRQKDQKIDFSLMQRMARQFEFTHCIEDHNLEDEQGIKLNFGNRLALDALDPKIGAEIESLIDEMNQEEDEDLEGFTESASRSSIPKTSEPELSPSPEK
jgi:hypothetical protein